MPTWSRLFFEGNGGSLVDATWMLCSGLRHQRNPGFCRRSWSLGLFPTLPEVGVPPTEDAVEVFSELGPKKLLCCGDCWKALPELWASGSCRGLRRRSALPWENSTICGLLKLGILTASAHVWPARHTFKWGPPPLAVAAAPGQRA